MTPPKIEPGVLRVLIVEDDTLVGAGIKAQLQRLGHQVVGQASNAAEAKERYQLERPDLVLMDIRLDGVDGLTLVAELLKERRCPMIVVSAYSDQELIERAGKAGVFGYLIKPITEAALAAQIEVALRRFEDIQELRDDKARLAKDLENRKLLERAKGILMKRSKLTEDEAHRRLQHESQNRRIPLADLCKKLIDSDEVFGR